MSKYHTLSSALSLSLFLILSCSPDTEIATYTVSQGDFVNALLVEGAVEPVLSTTLSSPRNCDGVVQFLVEDGINVEEGDVVCIIEYQELQNRYDQVTLSLENAEVGLNKTKADLNMQFALLEAQVKTNEADTRIAQMDSLQLAFVSPSQKKIKELELESAAIQKKRYEKKLTALKFIQQSEIRKLDMEMQRFRIQVQSIKEQLDALTIKAPRSGLAIRANSRLTGKKYQVGDPVWSNMPLVIMPEFKQMKIKIMASESDYKNISVKDSVFYTFDAMPGNAGTGKILKKAPVGQPYKEGGKVKFFEIEASIDSVLAMPEPGFTANCRIILKQDRNVVSAPQIAIFEEDSMKVVFVQRKKGFERRQVLTGLSSIRESVVTAGLEDGEIIALSKPKPSLVKEHIALPDSLTRKPETPADTLKVLPEQIDKIFQFLEPFIKK
jgi:multidrug efflux pump subunit AcrA (membrane-fusion protein)